MISLKAVMRYTLQSADRILTDNQLIDSCEIIIPLLKLGQQFRKYDSDLDVRSKSF